MKKTSVQVSLAFVLIYLLIGVLFNTAPPHIPHFALTFLSLHDWVQWLISILLWPLDLWSPVFTVSKWH